MEKNVVSTDEAMFYMGGTYGRRRVATWQTEVRKTWCICTWVYDLGRARTTFFNKGAKINAKYYKGKVLKSFLKKRCPRFFTGRENGLVFHWDSASSHTAKVTIDFLKKHNVNYITLVEWIPKKGPGAASMDIWIWAILNSRLQKQKVFTINGLEKLLKTEKNCINRTLKAGVESVGWFTIDWASLAIKQMRLWN